MSSMDRHCSEVSNRFMDNAGKDNVWRLAPDASIFVESRALLEEIGELRSAPMTSPLS